MQHVGSSKDSSLPFSEGNKDHVANNHMVVGVEVPSSQALALTASNLGALSSEISTAGNSTGNSSQQSCQRVPDSCSGTSRPRSLSPLEHPDLAITHDDDRLHGYRARSRRSHYSQSGSVKVPPAYRVRSRSRSYRSTRSHRSLSLTSSSGSVRRLGGSRTHSPRAYGYRAMRSHSRCSRRDGSPNYRSRQGQRSRS